MKKFVTKSTIGGLRVIIINDNGAHCLPPVRKRKKRQLPKNDFNLLGKSIANDLGFSELSVSIGKK